jgi:hypothetical protein
MPNVFVQIRAPKGSDPGRVLESQYEVQGDTVFLLDPNGKLLQKHSKKLTEGDNPKQIAARLLRARHDASRGGPRGFHDRIAYPKLRY